VEEDIGARAELRVTADSRDVASFLEESGPVWACCGGDRIKGSHGFGRLRQVLPS